MAIEYQQCFVIVLSEKDVEAFTKSAHQAVEDHKTLRFLNPNSVPERMQPEITGVAVTLDRGLADAVLFACKAQPQSLPQGFDIQRLECDLQALSALQLYSVQVRANGDAAEFTKRVILKQANEQVGVLITQISKRAEEGHAPSIAALRLIDARKDETLKKQQGTQQKTERSFQEGLAQGQSAEVQLQTALRTIRALTDRVNDQSQEIAVLRAELYGGLQRPDPSPADNLPVDTRVTPRKSG